MALKHIDGFDQFQGQSGQALLSALASAGYNVTSGIGMAAGRKDSTYALELQVSPGAAGSTWSSRANTIKADLHGVAANSQGRFVAVGDGGSATTTADGINWAPLVLGASANMKAVECNAGTFIAVGDSGTILRSTDGQNWSVRTAPIGAATLYDVAFGDGMWLAVGGLGAAGVIFVSTDDGMTWASVTQNPGTNANYCVTYGNGIWMVGGRAGQVIISFNGLSFVDQVFGSMGDVNDIAYFDGTWIAISTNSLRRSLDNGNSWSPAVDSLSGVPLRSIQVSDGRWVVGGDLGQLFMSDDTNTWVPPAFAGGQVNIYDINISSGAQVGWCLVGARTSSQAAATALIYVSLAPPTKFSRSFTSAQSRVVFGFAHRATARGRIFSVQDLFNMDWPAGIEILGVRGASVPIRNIWYYYEIVIDKVAGTLTLYVNDTLDLTVALPAAAANMTTYMLTWQAENGAVARIDDVYLLDSEVSATSTLANRLKPITIPIRMPDADVVTDWDTPNAGPHWSQVGLLPPSASSYVRSATSGAQDLYTSDDPLPVDAGTDAAPIIAVGLIALAAKSDLDNRQLGLVIGAPGNQKEIVDTTLSITMEYSTAVFEKAPGEQPWTVDSVLTTPFGVVVRP